MTIGLIFDLPCRACVHDCYSSATHQTASILLDNTALQKGKAGKTTMPFAEVSGNLPRSSAMSQTLTFSLSTQLCSSQARNFAN